MRVSELADLADTTVRTVRHYHHLGLLAVPDTPGGFRDYGLPHLARLLRIRWLVESGMSLAAIADVLPDDRPVGGAGITGELHDTLAELDESLLRLRTRRNRVLALLELAEAGEEVTPLPPALARMYQRLLRRMPTPASRRAVESERAMAVVLAVRGMLPAMVGEFADAATAADEDDVAEMFVALTDLDAPDATAADLPARRAAVIEPLTRVLVRHRELMLGAVRGDAVGTVDRRTLAGLLERLTALGYPETEQRRLIGEWTAVLGAPEFVHPDIPTPDTSTPDTSTEEH